MEIIQYKGIIEGFYSRLGGVTEEQAGVKLSEDKWSLKEILGHLVDSASNNHQRFIRLQFGDLLDFPPYEAEPWVKAGNYNKLDWLGLVSLWYNYNRHILNIIDNMGEGSLANVWVKGEKAIPLKELVVDYYAHIRLHITHFEERFAEIGKEGGSK